MRKILVLIDGYNFYHKLREFQHRFNRCVKWLNYNDLIKCYFDDYEDFEFEYFYFSAIAEFKGEDTINKHKTYIEALKNEGIKVVLRKFKEKTIFRCKCNEKCKNCNNIPDKTPIIKHEEKNTDVNIAITLIEKAINKEYEKCYIVSSDSDFNTAIKRAKEIYPQGSITLVPPPQVDNKNRKKMYFIDGIKNLTGTKPLFVSWKNILNSQFPDEYCGLKNPWKTE